MRPEYGNVFSKTSHISLHEISRPTSGCVCPFFKDQICKESIYSYCTATIGATATAAPASHASFHKLLARSRTSKSASLTLLRHTIRDRKVLSSCQRQVLAVVELDAAAALEGDAEADEGVLLDQEGARWVAGGEDGLGRFAAKGTSEGLEVLWLLAGVEGRGGRERCGEDEDGGSGGELHFLVLIVKRVRMNERVTRLWNE